MKPGMFIRVAVACGSFVLVGSGTSAAATLQFASFTKASTNVADDAVALTKPFVREQLRYERVREARSATEERIVRMFEDRGIEFPAAELYLRVFKAERKLELWARSPDKDKFQLLKTYEICALAGIVGPKGKQGDAQVPEGFYHIDLFNPTSSYHLSMRIDYPNKRDRLANTRKYRLGGDIFIHGGCKSEGCLAMTDAGISELYWIAVNAQANGQQRIPVHIFPARLHKDKDMKRIRNTFRPPPDILGFWDELKPGYQYFEKHRRVPTVFVDAQGHYQLAESSNLRKAD
ncbi:MAG TPA: L,D-transpeptidase family protein [Longimicrobiales bacterium]|nr:L,D-transpeptidase family protein [Longimicrobiales bacterium]